MQQRKLSDDVVCSHSFPCPTATLLGSTNRLTALPEVGSGYASWPAWQIISHSQAPVHQRGADGIASTPTLTCLPSGLSMDGGGLTGEQNTWVHARSTGLKSAFPHSPHTLACAANLSITPRVPLGPDELEIDEPNLSKIVNMCLGFRKRRKFTICTGSKPHGVPRNFAITAA